jgi:hypothetical protein
MPDAVWVAREEQVTDKSPAFFTARSGATILPYCGHNVVGIGQSQKNSCKAFRSPPLPLSLRISGGGHQSKGGFLLRVVDSL